MKKRTLLVAAVAATFSAGAIAGDTVDIFRKQWTYTHTHVGQISEIPAFDHKTNTIWVAGVVGVDVLDADDGHLVKHIDVTKYGFVNSVAIHNGLAAFAIESATRTDPVLSFSMTQRRVCPAATSNPLRLARCQTCLLSHMTAISCWLPTRARRFIYGRPNRHNSSSNIRQSGA